LSATAVDVAIVGAGIAGCAAALTLADSGLAVALIGPPADPAERIGESLAPAANRLLRELGVAADFSAAGHRAANAMYSAWGSQLLVERNLSMHLDGPGYVLNRAAFDNMLYRAAAATGALVLADQVTKVERRDSIWSVRLSGGSQLAARFLLDSSGRAAVVARRLAKRQRVDHLVVAYGFLQQSDDAVEPTSATLVEAVPEGWWYAALLPDQRLVLALFGDPDTLPRGVSRDLAVWRACAAATRHISAWLDSAGYAIDAPPRLASAATMWLEPVAGSGWAAAGDAAAAFDPLSSHGLTTALWSGRQAALAAAAALAGAPAPLAHYAATMRVASHGFLRQRRFVYGREQRWRNQPFWARRI
jgi:2-polyprenyl-6-methoxyphenol hydroxylase-like FAD-dependent oxidoreductase